MTYINVTNARSGLLADAAVIINGDRNNDYGPPFVDFSRTAAMWSEMFGRTFLPHEVALGMIAVKLSRIAETPHKRDHWLDIAGYVACGWECVELTFGEVD